MEQPDLFTPKSVRRPRLGEVVGYVLNFGPRGHVGQVRAAHVCRIWDAALGVVNLQVILDGANDMEDGKFPLPCFGWQTNVHHDPTRKKLGTWHYLDE